jgi:hypothetical protein
MSRTEEQRTRTNSAGRFAPQGEGTGWFFAPRGAARLSVSLVVLLVLTLAAPQSLAQSSSDDPGGAGGTTGVEAAGLGSITEPTLETTVVGLILMGRTEYERVKISDFDILFTEDDEPLIPLLRMLDRLGVHVIESGTTIEFRLDGAPFVTLDYATGAAVVDSLPRQTTPVVGLSDITYEPEIFVPYEDVSEFLAIDIAWDPTTYEIDMSVDRGLEVFRRRRESVALLRAGGGAEVELPGNLPPAGIDRSLAPRLEFLQLMVNTSAISKKDEEKISGSVSPPRLNLWAHLLGGNLGTTISQKSTSISDGVKLDWLAWNTYLSEVQLTLGTSVFGLSPLTFPTMSLLGARANGVVGTANATRQRDPSENGKRQLYRRQHVIDGYAPMGSEVTLLINGQEIDSMIVRDTDHAPPGEGVYRFTGLNLLVSRLSEIVVRVEEPDGTIEETVRDVLETDLLSDPGDLSFIVAGGGRRPPGTDDLSNEGRFGGARLSYGLMKGLTLAMTGAYQDSIYAKDALRFTGQDTLEAIPMESYHADGRVVWQLADPLLVFGEGARSEVVDTGEVDYAYNAQGELHVGGLRFYPAYFHYGPEFFDGVNPELKDVEGAAVGFVLRQGRGNELTFGASQLHDNVQGQLEETTYVTEGVVNFDLRRIIPNSTLSAGALGLSVNEDDPWLLYSMGFESNLFGGWRLRSRVTRGDPIRRLLRDELGPGASSKFDRILRQSTRYDVRAVVGSSTIGTRVDLRRRIGSNWQITFGHRSSSSQERTTFDLMRNAVGSSYWQWRFTPGYDWLREEPFVENRFEYLLGGSHRNRIVLEGHYRAEDWVARLSLQLQLNVGFADNVPVPMWNDYLNPDVGGVRGRVFVDSNGNGLRDSGEPGLENVDVSSGLGWRTSSRSRGLFVIPNTSFWRQTVVSLKPETLSAAYTPTQATQEAIIRPGMFTVINLGVGAFGAVSGTATGRMVEGEVVGVSGLNILLIDGQGKTAGKSITAADGSYYLGDVKPGSYTVRIQPDALPPSFELEVGEAAIDVFPDSEFFELEGIDFSGFYLEAPEVDEEAEEKARDETLYQVFD